MNWNQQPNETPDDRKWRINSLIRAKFLRDDGGTPDYFESLDTAWKIIERTRRLAGGKRWQFDNLLEHFLLDAYERCYPGNNPKISLDYISQLTPEIIVKTVFHLLMNNKEYFDVQEEQEKDNV
jgi:hypothetical protein